MSHVKFINIVDQIITAPTTHPAPPAEDQMEEGPRLATLATSPKPTAGTMQFQNPKSSTLILGSLLNNIIG